MNKTVWTWGILCGVVSISLMLASISIQTSHSELIGYTILVACALFVFFGIRSYRDNERGGRLTFGKAVQVGLLISLVSSVCYVVGWEAYTHLVKPVNMDGYFAGMEKQVLARHLPPAETQAKLEEIHKGRERYQNLYWNAAYTFAEPFPVLVVMTLISAGILRKKSGQSPPLVQDAAA